MIKIINQINQGVSSARNRGIEEAKYDWIAFLDADDEWLPDFLKTIQYLFDKYPNSAVFATSYFLQDNNGNQQQATINKLPFKGEEGLLNNYFKVATRSEPPINSSAVVIKKEAILSVGGFPVGVTSGEDLLTWARLAAEFEIAYSTKPYSIFTKDQISECRVPQTPDFVTIGLREVLLNHEQPFIKSYISNWHKMRAKSYLMLGRKGNALYEIVKAIQTYLFTRAWFFLPFIVFHARVFNIASEKFVKLFRN